MTFHEAQLALCTCGYMPLNHPGMGIKIIQMAAVPVERARCQVFLAPLQVFANDFGNRHGFTWGERSSEGS
jgi:hypothetical protein